MRIIKLTALFAACLILAFTSCRKKDNVVAEEIQGNWNIKDINKATGVVDPNSVPQSVTLNSCKVSKEDCIGEWVSNQGDKNNFFWTITDKGKTFTIIVDPAQPSNQATSDLANYQGEYNIEVLSETSFIVKKSEVTIEFAK